MLTQIRGGGVNKIGPMVFLTHKTYKGDGFLGQQNWTNGFPDPENLYGRWFCKTTKIN